MSVVGINYNWLCNYLKLKIKNNMLNNSLH